VLYVTVPAGDNMIVELAQAQHQRSVILLEALLRSVAFYVTRTCMRYVV